MKSSFFTGLDKRQSCDLSVVQSAVPDTVSLRQAATLALGLGLLLLTGSGFATTLPPSIDADVVRGFAVDAGAAKAKAPAAAASEATAAAPAGDAPPVAPTEPVAQTTTPKVEGPASPATAEAKVDTGGDRAALDPQVILGLAQPAVQQATAAPAPVKPAPTEPPPAPQAATSPAPMAEPRVSSAPVAQPAAPAPAPSQTAAAPSRPAAPATAAPPTGRSSIDANAIRGFATSQWPATGQSAAPSAPGGQPSQPAVADVASAGAAGSSPAVTPTPTTAADKPAQSSKLKPLSQADLDQLRSIFAPEM